MKKNIHPIIKSLIPIVKTISAMFGRNCEVVLHDLSNPQFSIIAIENGHVTGREIGGPITDLALSAWRNNGYGNKKSDLILNYKSESKEGKILKSSGVFIRDEKNNIVGCLCINYDLTEHIMYKNIIEEFCTMINLDRNNKKLEKSEETFATDVNEILGKSIQEAIQKIGKTVHLMQKKDKLKIVQILDKKGIFLIKGAITIISKELKVSRFTMYNYLEEIKNSN